MSKPIWILDFYTTMTQENKHKQLAALLGVDIIITCPFELTNTAHPLGYLSPIQGVSVIITKSLN